MKRLTLIILAALSVAAMAQVPLTFPPVGQPSAMGLRSDAYDGQWHLTPGSYYDADGHPYVVRVMVKRALPDKPRLCITQHASGGFSVTNHMTAAPADCDIDIRGQDGQVKKQAPWAALYGRRDSEWWAFGADEQPYAQRRNAGTAEVVAQMWPQIDLDRGVIVQGTSMGGAGVMAALLMPDPWRSRIALVRGAVPVFLMPRLVRGHGTVDFGMWPDDAGAGAAWWDSWDFARLAQTDPVVRGMHYRVQFSTTDAFARSAGGNSQIEFVNVLEAQRIGGVATWVANGHSYTEKGVVFPKVQDFEVKEQDVTLDRAHPAFTNSTGNWPLTAAERSDVNTYPRGHYNLGLTWVHAGIVDTENELSIPIRYRARGGFGAGIPDQPGAITVDVTPRRAKNFRPIDGEVLLWTFGAQSGQAVVHGDTATAQGLVLTSAAPAVVLTFRRP